MMSESMSHRAYLALGSNISPEFNLPIAAERLADYGIVIGVSAVWESPPVGEKRREPSGA